MSIAGLGSITITALDFKFSVVGFSKYYKNRSVFL